MMLQRGCRSADTHIVWACGPGAHERAGTPECLTTSGGSCEACVPRRGSHGPFFLFVIMTYVYREGRHGTARAERSGTRTGPRVRSMCHKATSTQKCRQGLASRLVKDRHQGRGPDQWAIRRQAPRGSNTTPQEQTGWNLGAAPGPGVRPVCQKATSTQKFSHGTAGADWSRTSTWTRGQTGVP